MNNKVDFFTGLGIEALSALVYYSASQMPSVELGLGAGGFPKFIAVCLMIFAALLSIKAFINIRKGKKDAKRLDAKELAYAGLLAAAFALYIVVIRYLGYIISTSVFFFIFMLIYGQRKWLRMCIISVSFSVAVFFLFEKVFYIMLPRGRIF